MAKQKGRFKYWNPEKGFGFITPLNGGDDIFVHHSALDKKDSFPMGREPKGSSAKGANDGDEVVFEAESSDRGLKAKQYVVLASLAEGEANAESTDASSNVIPVDFSTDEEESVAEAA